MLQHLEQMHGILLRKPADSDDKKQCATIASYGQNELNKYYRAMSLATAVNLYPMRLWENLRDVVTLLNPRVPPPSGKVVRRFLDELMADEANRLKDFVLKKLTASIPMVSLEIDMWPSPAHGHFFGCWLHGITVDWQAVSLLLHCQPFGAISHTSANQAQRLRSAVAGMFGKEVDNLAYILASDNAPDAAGVCRLLGLESGRCGAHIIALAAAHLNFHVLRQNRLVMHERAIPEIFQLLEKCRTLAKLFLRRCGNEANAGVLEATMQRLSEPVLVTILDKPSKWSSTYLMLSRHLRIKRSMMDVSVQIGHRMPHGTFLGEPEYLLLRDITGVLRPLKEATNMIQTDEVIGSSYLPILHTLLMEMKEEAPVHVRAGDASHKELMPLDEGHLQPAARRYRAALRQELEIVMRHVEPCRESMEIAAMADPRFRHLPWTTSASERLAMRRRFTDQVVSAAEKHFAQTQQAQDKEKDIASGGTRQKRRRLVRNSSDDLASFSLALNRHCSEAAPAARDRGVEKVKQEAQVQAAAYLQGPGEPLDQDVLRWWRKTGSEAFPHVARLARQRLATPASVARLERTWSHGRHMLHFARNAIDGHLAGATIRLQANASVLGMLPGTESQDAGPDCSSDEEDVDSRSVPEPLTCSV